MHNLGNPFKTAKIMLIKPYFEKRKSAQVIRILALYIHKENTFLTRIFPKNMLCPFNQRTRTRRRRRRRSSEDNTSTFFLRKVELKMRIALRA